MSAIWRRLERSYAWPAGSCRDIQPPFLCGIRQIGNRPPPIEICHLPPGVCGLAGREILRIAAFQRKCPEIHGGFGGLLRFAVLMTSGKLEETTTPHLTFLLNFFDELQRRALSGAR